MMPASPTRPPSHSHPATHPALRTPDPTADQPTVAVPVEGGGPDSEATTEKRAIPHTRTGGLWAALILSAVVLIFLLVFILQNTEPVAINFLWLTGTLRFIAVTHDRDRSFITVVGQFNVRREVQHVVVTADGVERLNTTARDLVVL